MNSDKLYSTRANSARAARKALEATHPKGAISGVHFKVTDNKDGYGWETIDDGGAAPVKEAKPRAVLEVPPTKDQTPTPPTAASKPDPATLYAALGGTVKAPATPRWRKPKKTPASKVAYRPRAGSLQERMYTLLTQCGPDGERGITVEEFCDFMAKAGAKPTMTKHEQTWSNLGYLFVSLRGYGLEFDGSRIWLLVPKEERDAVAGKKGGA
jgi:hypothetical protein